MDDCHLQTSRKSGKTDRPVVDISMPPLGLNDTARQLIVGSMLGDGSFRRGKRNLQANSPFVKTQSTLDYHGDDKIEYMQWHVDLLKGIGGQYRRRVRKDGRQEYELTTSASPELAELERQWYPITEGRRVKRVPAGIVLSPLALCVWFMDDGTAYFHKRQGRLYTCGFGTDECELLKSALKRDLGIKAGLQRCGKNKKYWSLYVGPESFRSLIETIRPFCVWNCFRYKYDLDRYREQKGPPSGERNGQSKLTDADVALVAQMMESGQYSQKEVAAHFGVHQGTVSKILSGKRRKPQKEKPSRN